MNRRLFLCLMAAPVALSSTPAPTSLRGEFLRLCVTQGLMTPERARYFAGLPTAHRDWSTAPASARQS